MGTTGLLGLAAILIFVATVSQTVRTIPAKTVISINALAVPVGTFCVSYAVTSELIFSLIFAVGLAAVAVPVVAWAIIRRGPDDTGSDGTGSSSR